MHNIKLLKERFMNNEYYELQRKFEVLAKTPVKNLEDYVKLTCEELKIFMFEASQENPMTSLIFINILQNE